MQLHPGNVNHYFIRVLNIGLNSITSSDKIADFFGKRKWKQSSFSNSMSIGEHLRVNYAERSLLLWMCCVMRSTARRESQARESAAMFRPEQLPTANLTKVIVLLPS